MFLLVCVLQFIFSRNSFNNSEIEEKQRIRKESEAKNWLGLKIFPRISCQHVRLYFMQKQQNLTKNQTQTS